jgi:hypothetical protein
MPPGDTGKAPTAAPYVRRPSVRLIVGLIAPVGIAAPLPPPGDFGTSCWQLSSKIYNNCRRSRTRHCEDVWQFGACADCPERRANAVQFAQWKQDYAACRRVISVKAASPSAVNEYGAFCSRPLFLTNRFRLRYCIRAFIDCCGMLNRFVTSMIRSSPESKITDNTLRMRSDPTGRRGACARRAD